MALPESCVDAGGRHAARANVERMGDRAGQRMAHAHLPRRSTSRRHAQVAAAVDGAAPVALEPRHEKVSRPSLGRAPQVDLQAGWPTDHARVVVDLHRAPSGGRVRPSRATGWRCPQRLLQRRGRHVRQRPAVTVTTQRTEERRVDEAGAQGRRAQRRRDRGAEQWPGRDGGPGICVQPGQIAARVKARQPAIDLGEDRPHVDLAVSVAHDPRKCAHRREVVVEHAPRAAAVSRPLGRRLVAARLVGPCRRRKPAACPRSGRDWTGSSRAGAVAGSDADPPAANELPHTAGRCGHRDRPTHL